MKKFLAITWNEITLRSTDPSLLLLAIVMPLVIAALINLAFGDLVLGRGIPDTKVPVGIVNQDQGGQWGNFGQLFVRALIPDPDEPMPIGNLQSELFSAREIGDEARARRLVERGKLVAVLIIPADFSEALAAESAVLEVYIDGKEDILGAAFKSAVEIVANAISSGEVTVRTTVEGLLRSSRTRIKLETGQLDEDIADLALAAALPDSNPIQIRRLEVVDPPAQVKLTHYLAATITVMFVSFAALILSAMLFQEKAQWTLQRLYITPTRPGIILSGKALGTFLTGLLQMTALVIGMAALEWVLGGRPGAGQKINPFGLAALVSAVAAATTGMGAMIAGLTKTYAQASNYGRALLLLMGLMGGVFFPVKLFPKPFDMLSRVTFHYWAIDGYVKLALGGDVRSIIPHVLILVVMGALFFAIGSHFLRRRIEFL